MKRLLSIFLAVLLLAALLSGCTQGSAQNQKSALFEEVVVQTEEGFTFTGLDWSMTKDEVMEKLGVSADTVGADLEDRFTVAVHSDELNADGWATYVFISGDEPLCAGWYYFPVNDGDGEEKIWSKVKEMALTCLPEPETEWKQGESMKWEGADGSTVSVLFNAVENAPEGTYPVTLEVSCPPIPSDE